MKITYFSYHFLNKNNDKILYDIRPFLDAFVKNAPKEFKQKFKVFDDHLYLFNTTEKNLYFFMRTRDDEIIQKIDNDTLSIDDIRNHLNANETLGFSSYVYFGEDFIGFSSTHLAPRVNSLGTFLNDILKIVAANYSLLLEPIVTSLSKNEAKKLKLVSRAYIKVPAEKTFGQDFMGIFNQNQSMNDLKDLEYIELTIKAGKDKSISRNVMDDILDNIDEKDRLILRAKEDLADSLRDYYIEESGSLSDTIYKRKKANETEEKIVETIVKNEELTRLLEEKKEYETFEKTTIHSLTDCYTNNTWTM